MFIAGGRPTEDVTTHIKGGKAMVKVIHGLGRQTKFYIMAKFKTLMWSLHNIHSYVSTLRAACRSQN